MRRILLGTSTCVLVLLVATGCRKSSTVEGKGKQQLTLIKPVATTLERGSTEKVTVQFTRDHVTEPVAVQIGKLPDGVTVEQNDQKVEGDQAVFVLKADEKADLVKNHQAMVTLKGPDGLTVSEMLDLTVREKS